ncbi:MAG: ribosomal protein S18 acetylase RimI-like enzyme [Paracoccaceae bacterium]|jgi:ribosomal protein S18 acetylase RimI-like enzyme
MPQKRTITPGFHEAERAQVAGLFWQAFGPKLGKVMRPEARALAFFETALNPEFALVARDAQGRLLGLAGFKTDQGGMAGGSLAQLAQVYGWVGAMWRGMVLSVLERKVQAGVFQMDGIFVDAAARGMGVGTALLQAVADAAAARGLEQVQLDVIDTNPRARALYERVGFRATSTEQTGPFKWVFGFDSATRMVLPVVPGDDGQMTKL